VTATKTTTTTTTTATVRLDALHADFAEYREVVRVAGAKAEGAFRAEERAASEYASTQVRADMATVVQEMDRTLRAYLRALGRAQSVIGMAEADAGQDAGWEQP